MEEAENAHLKLREKLSQFKQTYIEKGWEDDEIDEKISESLEMFPWYKFKEEKISWVKRLWNIFLVMVILYLAIGAYLAKNRRLRKTIHDKMFDLQLQYQQVRFFRFISLPIFTRVMSLQRLTSDSCLLSNPFYSRPSLDCNFCANNTAINFLDDAKNNITEALKTGEIFALSSVHGYENSTIQFSNFKDLFSKHGDEMDEAICEIYHSNKFAKISDYFLLTEAEVNHKEVSIGWKNCEGYGSRFYRELFIRPSFVSKTAEIYLEKYFFFLQPGGNYSLDSIGESDGHSYILQVQGESMYSFFVPGECHDDCVENSMNITLTKGQVVIYPNTGWKFSVTTYGKDLAISYMSSFLG